MVAWSSLWLITIIYLTNHNVYVGSSTINVNMTLPLDASVSEGDMAVFECQFGTATPRSCNSYHTFKYYHQDDNNSIISVLDYSHFCSSRDDVYSPFADDRYGINVSLLEDNSVLREFRYIFYIRSADVKENGSIFSCSVVSNGQIQWQRNATLIVYRGGIMQYHVDNYSYRYVAAIAVVIPVFVVALSITSLLLWMRRRKNRMSAENTEADQGIFILCFN